MKLTRHKVYVPMTVRQGLSFCASPKRKYQRLFTSNERVTAFASQEEAIETKRPKGRISGRSTMIALVRVSICADLQRALSGMVQEKRTAKGEPFIMAGAGGRRLISLGGMKEIVNHPETHVWMKPVIV